MEGEGWREEGGRGIQQYNKMDELYAHSQESRELHEVDFSHVSGDLVQGVKMPEGKCVHQATKSFSPPP